MLETLNALEPKRQDYTYIFGAAEAIPCQDDHALNTQQLGTSQWPARPDGLLTKRNYKMNKNGPKLIHTCALIISLGCVVHANAEIAQAGGNATAPAKRYTFSWLFTDTSELKPRGGTTKGTPVQLDKAAGSAWTALQAQGLSKQERDRRAILAMAGEYRASFDFIEVAGFTPGYEPVRPYQSWGTEQVYVVTDEPDFVSLQHVMVLFFESDGQTMGPMVIKHWRQDWHWQARELTVYTGHNTWGKTRVSRNAAKGAWLQAVYQVDDSPRYQSLGRWTHNASQSNWLSEETWRPIPRREFSVRDDYHVLVGTNRHTITRSGWIQEENNLKVVLLPDGSPDPAQPHVARELGVNRYDRIIGHDFAAGNQYWSATGVFWADVRATWRTILDERKSISLAEEVDGQALLMVMLGYASGIEAGGYDPAAGKGFINATLAKYLR